MFASFGTLFVQRSGAKFMDGNYDKFSIAKREMFENSDDRNAFFNAGTLWLSASLLYLSFVSLSVAFRFRSLVCCCCFSDAMVGVCD